MDLLCIMAVSNIELKYEYKCESCQSYMYVLYWHFIVHKYFDTLMYNRLI